MSNPADLLPANATPFQRALSKTSARLLDADTDIIRRERDPLLCDKPFVPFLASERSVHHYTGVDATTDRARTASSYADHRSYGAAPALEQEISTDTGQTIRVIECWEDPDLSFPDFIVESVINPGAEVPDMAAAARSAIARKNVRDTLARTRVRVNQPVGVIYYGAAAYFSVRMTPVVTPPPRGPFLGGAGRFLPSFRIVRT